MKDIPFSKYHANGNDFIIIDSVDFDALNLNEAFIRRLCDRNTGVGADGLFVVSNSKTTDYKIDYFNSDGTWETFCANGSRCVLLYMNHKNNDRLSFTFLSGSGEHIGNIDPNKVVTMTMPIPYYQSKNIAPIGISGYHIDSGARHFVCEYDPLDEKALLSIGKSIRNDQLFEPHGININFYQCINRSSVQIITYEKGIENIVKSCSSGSAAVVFHLAKKGIVESPVKTISPGGSLLYTFDDDWMSFSCSGEAVLCFWGHFNVP